MHLWILLLGVLACSACGPRYLQHPLVKNPAGPARGKASEIFYDFSCNSPAGVVSPAAMKPKLDPRFDDVLRLFWQPTSNPKHLYRGDYLQLAVIEQTSPFPAALAARLSHESWSRSTPDTDAALLARLEESGDEHAKGLRWLQYCLLIDAPRYWWAEMDTYTVGVVPMGSTSTMHKEAKRLKADELVAAKAALPEGTRQLRIRGFSYHALKRIRDQRCRHRLPEWQDFCGFFNRLFIRNPLRW